MLAPRKTLHSTPPRVMRSALELLDVTTNDVFYDVGCGDGRLVIHAAQRYGARAVGIEIDRDRAQQARDAVEAAGVAHLVTIHHGNALDFDFADATIVFLFLIERGLGCVCPCGVADDACTCSRTDAHPLVVYSTRLIRNKLERLPAPCRVLTYLYKFPGALLPESKRFLRARDTSDDVAFPVFMYTFPTAASPVTTHDRSSSSSSRACSHSRILAQ